MKSEVYILVEQFEHSAMLAVFQSYADAKYELDKLVLERGTEEGLTIQHKYVQQLIRDDIR